MTGHQDGRFTKKECREIGLCRPWSGIGWSAGPRRPRGVGRGSGRSARWNSRRGSWRRAPSAQLVGEARHRGARRRLRGRREDLPRTSDHRARASSPYLERRRARPMPLHWGREPAQLRGRGRRTRSASRVYTHAIDLHGRSSLYHKHGFRRVSEAVAELEGHSGAVLLCKELR